MLFENSLFQNLSLRKELNYYQKKSGVEIDFILNKEKSCEVKIKPYPADIEKLSGFAKDLSLGEYKIVSKNFSELKNIIYGFML